MSGVIHLLCTHALPKARWRRRWWQCCERRCFSPRNVLEVLVSMRVLLRMVEQRNPPKTRTSPLRMTTYWQEHWAFRVDPYCSFFDNLLGSEGSCGRSSSKYLGLRTQHSWTSLPPWPSRNGSCSVVSNPLLPTSALSHCTSSTGWAWLHCASRTSSKYASSRAASSPSITS